MKRLDPDAIARSFAAHPEVKPTRLQLVQEEEDGTITACCAVARALLDAGFGPSDSVEDVLGIDAYYEHGFCAAWDGLGSWWPERIHSELYHLGYQDGLAAWEATRTLLEKEAS